MNDLSWLIYFSNVVSNLSAVCVLILFMAIIATAILCIIHYNEGFTPKAFGYVKRLVILSLVLSLLVVVIPDRKTILLIAAAQVAERVINTTQVQNMVEPSIDLLNAWIKKELDTISKPAK